MDFETWKNKVNTTLSTIGADIKRLFELTTNTQKGLQAPPNITDGAVPNVTASFINPNEGEEITANEPYTLRLSIIEGSGPVMYVQKAYFDESGNFKMEWLPE